MLSNAVAFFGCMALLFISGVSTDENTVEVVENCQAGIDKCRKIAATDDKILEKQTEIATCFSGFICKDSEDDARVKALLEYGVRIANNKFKDPTTKSSNLALTISASYTHLILTVVTAFVLA